MEERYLFQALDERHLPHRGAFSCGIEALDTYLRERARKEIQQRLAAVWVLFDAQDDRIAAYYTLSAVAIRRSTLPPEFTHRMARYESYPATLIGRLAVDRTYQGRRLGALALLDALRRSLAAARAVASVAVVTDAKDDSAQRFYQRYGFMLLASEQHGRRLFLPMGTVERLFSGRANARLSAR